MRLRHGHAELPAIDHQHVVFDDGLTLECGVVLPRLVVAYRTYGPLNAERSNAVLICHALTGDQYVAETHPVTGKPGWWDDGGRPRPAGRHRPVLRDLRQRAGRLHGLHRARSPRNADDPTPWGTDFPPVTIRDMVRAQKRLIDHLGIARLFAVIGGSMGGMQVLEWAAAYPDAVFAAVPIATAAYHSAQNIAFHEVGRQAIFADPDWQRRALLGKRQGAGARPGGGAHGARTSPISPSRR